MPVVPLYQRVSTISLWKVHPVIYLCVFHVTEDNSKYGRKNSETMALSKEGEEQRLMN